MKADALILRTAAAAREPRPPFRHILEIMSNEELAAGIIEGEK